MKRQERNGYRLVLLGLILAFLHSALILPLCDSEEKDSQKQNLTLSPSNASHSPHNDPISLPGEEKEEENRGEKDSKLALDIPNSSFEYSLSFQVEITSFQLVQAHASLQTNIPLYLLKQSLII